MLYCISYVSTITKELNQSQLKELLDNVVHKNLNKGITGILLYNSGNFLQYLEGPEDKVKMLYDKIFKDIRHKDVIAILHKKVEVQYFSGFKAGYSSIIEKNQIRNLKSYLNLLKYLDSKEIKMFTNTVNSFLSLD